MAERRPARGGSETTKQADRAPRSGRAPRDDGANGTQLTAAEAGRDALQQLVDLTGKEPEGVSGVEPAEDGWIVTVDVVEARRIPSTSDMIATYEMELAPDGELISYRRVRRYTRGRVDDGTE
jgi:hypothetical protein